MGVFRVFYPSPLLRKKKHHPRFANLWQVNHFSSQRLEEIRRLNLRRKKNTTQTHQTLFYHKVDDHKKERIWHDQLANLMSQLRFWHDIWHNLANWLFFKRSWFETHDAPMIYIHRSWICHNLTTDSGHAHLPASIGIARHLQPRPGDFFRMNGTVPGKKYTHISSSSKLMADI